MREASRREIRSFLRSRREALTPPDVGLPWNASGRRVKGLRREEVAALAGLSADYYARLEQGRAESASDQVLDAVAAALRLDELERAHLYDLYRGGPASAAAPGKLRAALADMLETLNPWPAYVRGPRMEILGINRMGRVILSDFPSKPAAERNMALWILLDPHARAVYPEWETIAREVVASLRMAAAAAPSDPVIDGILARLALESPEFNQWWDHHQVYRRGHGVKGIRHESVGELVLHYESMNLVEDENTLVLYTAPAGSAAEEKIRLLESWDSALQLPVRRLR